MIGGIVEIGSKIVDKLIPDPVERDKAKAKLLEVEQAGEFKELDARYSTIEAEAKSDNFLTSAARPMFMWVMYIMILASLPAAYFYIEHPEETKQAITGMRLWLDSIPSDMWLLFGAGFLGYTTNRSNDKARKLGVEPKQGFLSKILG